MIKNAYNLISLRSAQLSDGQKARVVLAKMGREGPHIMLLDEPTNHLDMESIDSLAIAIQNFTGGVILVSHDMRLISQVAKEIWVCQDRTIHTYKGDINKFKMEMRVQLGIDSGIVLKGDSSSAAKKVDIKEKTAAKKPVSSGGISVAKRAPTPTPAPAAAASAGQPDAWSDDEQEHVVPPPAPAVAAAPVAGGACPETGKCEWRLCGTCGKRHQ